MWGEFVDAVSVIPRTWPRASAVAERLWSNAAVNSPRAAATRLEEHRYCIRFLNRLNFPLIKKSLLFLRCRLVRRGFNVDPLNGVSYCDVEW